MDRTEVEKITQSPLTFKSTFSVSSTTLLSINTGTIRSERCGLGWAFRIEQASPPVAPTGQPVGRRGKIPKAKRVHATDTPVANGSDAAPAMPTGIISCAILYLELEPTTVALSGQFTFDRVACHIDTTSLGERCFDKTAVVFSPETILGTFEYASADIVTIAVSVEFGHRTDAISKSIDGRVATTLEDSLQSGDMVDAKIYTYSKRCGYKQAGHPRAMYVNSAILHKFGCEELDLHLAMQGFKDSKTTALDLYCVSPEDMVTDQYDYDSDSDLEDDDELDCESTAVALADEMDELAQDLIYMQGESKNRFLRTGRAVFFRATAYRTWSAFVRYVYFDTTAYAKLKSTYSDEKEAAARFSEKTCSPKSMYRFAEQFGIESLEASALESIKNQLTVDNIVDELFSQFSLYYPKVIDVEVEFLLRNFTDEKVRARLQDVAGRAFAGGTYMEAAWRKMLSEMQVSSSSRACNYNQYCNRCNSYHQYHHS